MSLADDGVVFFEPRSKRASHDGKIGYATLTDALLDLAEIRMNHPDWGFMLAYPCRWCPRYHVGHPPKSRPRWKKGKRKWST